MSGFNLVMASITIIAVVGAVMIVRGLTKRCEKVLEGIDRVGELLDLKPLQDFQDRLDASAQLLTAHEKDIKALKALVTGIHPDPDKIRGLSSQIDALKNGLVALSKRLDLHSEELVRLNRLRGQIAVALEIAEPAKV